MSIHEEAERRYPDCSDPRHKQHYNEVRIARAVFVEGAEWMQSERDEVIFEAVEIIQRNRKQAPKGAPHV